MRSHEAGDVEVKDWPHKGCKRSDLMDTGDKVCLDNKS